MNVPAITMPVGASGTVTAAMGQAGEANAATAGLGELFSLQIGFALQNLQTEEGISSDQQLTEEELQAMEELMTLIQQLLMAQQKNVQEAEAFLAENGKTIEQLMQKLQGPLPQLANDWKQLLSKLTEEEPATDDMQKIADLLQRFLGDKSSEQVKRGPVVRADATPVGTGFQDLGKMIQPLRINQGLQAYKQEAGIQVQTAQTLQTSGLMAKEQGESLAQPVISTSIPTTAGSLQTMQTFETANAARTYTVPSSQFPEQVTQIFVKQMNLTQTNGLHQAKLVLHPEALGQVNVTITSHNGVITAQFTAETQAGRELLDNQMLNLRTALTQNGLQVDRLEVTQQQASESFDLQQQREQAKQQQEQQSQQREQQGEQSEFVLESLVDDEEAAASVWNQLRGTSRGVDDVV